MEAYLHYCRHGELKKVQEHFCREYQEEGFQIACDNGQLDVAQWLYYQGGIHDLYRAFEIACYNGQLSTVQWIYAVGNIDISRDNYFALRYAEKNHHLPVVEWLRSLME